VGASLKFRSYLAARDEFVRSAGRGVWRVRVALGRGDEGAAHTQLSALDRDAVRFAKLLAVGESAARTMWRRTRDPRTAGPNESMLMDDAERLRSWRAWLRRCMRRPVQAWESSPVVGAWQLLFTVKNFAPALQKVVIEQQGPSGSWADLDGLFLIEFRARSARPRSNVTNQLSIPIAWPGPPSPMPTLRIAVRGFGQVAISRIRLTNGVTSFKDPSGVKVVGLKAPRSGFPDFDFQANRGELLIAFAK
jgi:hypothetical protein